jgi:hypothetical protein
MSMITTHDGTDIYDKDRGSGQLRKTVLPVIAIALCMLLSLAVSACSGATQTQGKPTTDSGATSGSAGGASKPLPALKRTAGFTDKQWLGKQLFFDSNLSSPPGQACKACHDPATGWADPRKDSPTSEGNTPGLFGEELRRRAVLGRPRQERGRPSQRPHSQPTGDERGQQAGRD